MTRNVNGRGETLAAPLSVAEVNALADAVANIRKTHCGGHPYSGANLYVEPTTGKRFCRECGRIA